jgi:hypothetical protein
VDVQVPAYEVKRSWEGESSTSSKKVPPIILKKKRSRRKNPKYFNAEFCE